MTSPKSTGAARPWSPTPSATTVQKPQRRLKPEVLARLAERRTVVQVQELYEKPVHELSPEEIARMRAAFFRG